VNRPTVDLGPVPSAEPSLIAGRFRIVGLLGSGGSASVFEARDFEIDRTVALKILHPHLSMTEEMRRGFLLEAAVAENLTHPNIAAVLASGVHGTDRDSFAWIALELAPGISLAERVGLAGALQVDDALTVADGVLSALEAAHAKGMVHRDISPANVMVDYPATGAMRPANVRLVDFGLADAIGRSTAASDLVRSERADTARNGILGSVNYMSPEQAMGRPVGERGDLYQAGATLYFALTGLPPYRRDSPEAVMRAHLEAPPPVPSVLAAGIPGAVDRIVVTAMSTDENGRYASATEMRRAVRDAVTAGVVQSPTRLLVGQPASRALQAKTTVYRARPTRTDGPPRPRVELALAPASAPASAPQNRRLALAIATAAITSVFAITWILAANTSPDSSSSSAPSKASATPSRQPTGTVASVPRPAVVSTVIAVPALVSLSLDQARTALVSAGLIVGTVSSLNSPAAAGTVLSAGDGRDRAARGTHIHLVVASGSNAVPRVAGLTVSAAVDTVRSAGFVVTLRNQADSDDASDTVLGSSPGEAAILTVGSEVVIDVAVPGATVPTVTPTPTPTPVPTPTPTPTAGPSSSARPAAP
jgi:serine/threonine protein kinase